MALNVPQSCLITKLGNGRNKYEISREPEGNCHRILQFIA